MNISFNLRSWKQRRLLKKLETAPALNINGMKLPDEKIVKKIGVFGDASAIPALELARIKAGLFEKYMRFAGSSINPILLGSGSVMAAGLLATQTINTIDEVIRSLQQVQGSRKNQ